MSDIIASCSPEVQGQLLGLSYQDLLTKKEGREVAKKLVTAVINQQIGRQLSVSWLELISRRSVDIDRGSIP